jgi:hypothetical protein
MMSNLYEVVRPIPGPDGMIDKGQTVDVADWRARNVKQLVERRYLRPATVQPAVTTPAPATLAPAGKGKPDA